MGKVILVRHGQTAWHAEGRYAGTADIPLDELGLEQARRVADHFKESKIEVIYSSPLSRCLELAKMVAAAHDLEVIVDERLREIDPAAGTARCSGTSSRRTGRYSSSG